MRLDVSDILESCKLYRAFGTDPATGTDCLYVARQVVRRRFPGMPDHELPITEDQILEAIDIGAPAGPWSKVGETSAAATKLGDLVFGKKPDGSPFVMAVVDEVGRQCLTSMPMIGACVRSTRHVAGIVAVYRRSEC